MIDPGAYIALREFITTLEEIAASNEDFQCVAILTRGDNGRRALSPTEEVTQFISFTKNRVPLLIHAFHEAVHEGLTDQGPPPE